ncbi:MAG TPA: hypothetical protein ENF73_06245, partial [Proteobacteria bacterium]|nr:hypothetical protein [Pseudomonadota bacterium]
MKVVWFCSTDRASGKSLFAFSVIRKLRGMGIPFDVVKLGGVRTAADEAEIDFLNAMGVSPVDLTESGMAHGDPKRGLEQLRPKSELVIVIGTERIFSDAEPDLDSEAKLADQIGAHLFLAHRYSGRADLLYTTLALKSYLGDKLAGILINRVPGGELEAISKLAAEELNPKGIPVIAVLPEDRILGSATLEEIAGAVEGEFLVDGGEARLVESHTLGTSAYAGRLSIFKRLWQRIALIGGTEVELA